MSFTFAQGKKPYISPYYANDDDRDGVPNGRDKCINTPKGTKVTTFGCPIDTDFDEIYDYEDECPTEKGPRSNKGCPIKDLDRDHDGILDKDDICPDLAGSKKNKGCPEVKKQDKEKIDNAFKNLLFETNSDVIKSSSFSSLTDLANVLIKNPTYSLLLAGHTDSVGTDIYNLELSQNRVISVKNYLIKKGVDEKHIKLEWYGENKPIDTNGTIAGRSKNRRVEMNIFFKQTKK